RFWWHVGKRRKATVLLVEVEPQDFRREREVLDGSPAGYKTELRDVEVGVASVVDGFVCRIVTSCRSAGAVERAIYGLGSVVVTNSRIAAEQAGRPVGVPVVVEGTTDAEGFGEVETTVTAKERGQPHRVGSDTEANALVGTGTAGAAEHREVRRNRRG